MLKLLVLGAVVILGYVETKSNTIQLDPAMAGKLMKDILFCVGDVGLNTDLLLQIKNKTYPEDDSIKQFLGCTFNKLGIASKKGAIKVDKFLDIYPENADKESLRKAIQQCEQDSGEPLDRIFNFFKCYQQNTPVHISLMRH